MTRGGTGHSQGGRRTLTEELIAERRREAEQLPMGEERKAAMRRVRQMTRNLSFRSERKI